VLTQLGGGIGVDSVGWAEVGCCLRIHSSSEYRAADTGGEQDSRGDGPDECLCRSCAEMRVSIVIYLGGP